MNDDSLERWRETLLRRELTADELREVRRRLEQHPGERESWAQDLQLSRVLRDLPSAPVASNFTARVMEEIRREGAVAAHARRPWWRVPRWNVAALGATAVVALSLGSWQWRQQDLARQAREVASLRALADVPPVALEDFEAIRTFGASTPAVDFELLAALQ